MCSFSRAEKMTALKGKEMCSSCFRETGYCCIMFKSLFVTGVGCSRKMKVLLAGSWEDQ